MQWREIFKYVEDDIKRTHAAVSSLDHTYVLRLWAIFIINTLGVIGLMLFKENFPLPVFLVIFAVSAVILFDMLWNVCRKNIRDNFPASFDVEAQKYGEPEQCLKCRLIMVGNLRFRGFSCRIYVYKKVLIVRYRKNCLVITNEKQVEIKRFLWEHLCEFKDKEKYVRCFLNEKQAEIIEAWSKDYKTY